MSGPGEGTWIAGCRLESLLGHGGMGTVWRARQERAGRDVALKLIRPGLSEDPAVRERFEHEARMAVALQHPSIVPVHDFGEDGRTLWILMQLVPGEDLKAVLRREGPLAPARAAHVVAQVADALDYAHDERRVIHRDVKPENILLRRSAAREHAYLTDFGIARALDATTRLTQHAGVMGTAPYIPPEGWEGRPFDRRGDVYALGCVAYEALTGASPFARVSDAATRSAHLEDPLPSLRGMVAEPLAAPAHAVLARAVAKDPAERYGSAGAFARALEGVVQRDPAGEDDVTRTMTPPTTQRRTPRRPTPQPPVPPPAPPKRRVPAAVIALAALVAVAVAAFAIASGGDDDEAPTASEPGPKATTSARPPLPPVPNASGEGEVQSFARFRTRVPPNWEVESEDVPRDQTRLGQARVTTFRPKDGAAPDRVSVLLYGSGEFSAKSRVDRREANLKGSPAYHAGDAAKTVPVGPHAETIVWSFDTDEKEGRLRWERYAFDVGGVGFEVVGGGRPKEVADVARVIAENLDLVKECPTDDEQATSLGLRTLTAINTTCEEARFAAVESPQTCAPDEPCRLTAEWTCALGEELRCEAAGRREIVATFEPA